ANRTPRRPVHGCGPTRFSASTLDPRRLAEPPAAGDCSRPLPKASAQKMLPSSAQLAPAEVVPASPIGTTAPPSTEILFSLPPAEKPIHCPSGEKNGWLATPSVP